MATVMSTLSFNLACMSASGAKRNLSPGQKKYVSSEYNNNTTRIKVITATEKNH